MVLQYSEPDTEVPLSDISLLDAAVKRTVPTIDISGLFSPHEPDRRDVAHQIGAAAEHAGFFSVVGHGVHPAIIRDAFAETRRLFRRPLGEKMLYRWSDVHPNRGFDPAGSQRLDENAEPDRKEAWSFSPEHQLDNGHPMNGPNQWPPLEGFKTPIQRYHMAVMDLAERLLAAMALSLGLDEAAFQPFHRQPICTLRLLHYPARPRRAGSRSFGAGAHTDWGALTLLAQDDTGSLEVLDKDGHWLEVPPQDDAFVVNVGDLLARWTNDRYQSTVHRVRGAIGRERYSMAVFFDLDPDAVIETLPTCISAERPARYGPTTPGEHLAERYATSRQ